MTHPCLKSPTLCSFPSDADSIGDPETSEEPQSLMSFSSSLLSVVLQSSVPEIANVHIIVSWETASVERSREWIDGMLDVFCLKEGQQTDWPSNGTAENSFFPFVSAKSLLLQSRFLHSLCSYDSNGYVKVANFSWITVKLLVFKN